MRPDPGSGPETTEGPEESRHLVVLGFPRGGTSLLMTALGEHSQIAMLDEDLVGGITRLTGSKIRGVKLCVPNQVQMDVTWKEMMRYHPVYRFLRLTGRLQFSAWRNTRPRSRWSIRDYAALPNTTFICLLRDPAKSLDAIRRRQGIETPAGRTMWHLFMKTMTSLEAMRSHPVIFMSFERLVRDPETQLRSLCNRLGVPFEPGMLDGPRFNRRYPGRKFDPAKAEAAGIPDAEELGLSPAALADYVRLLETAV